MWYQEFERPESQINEAPYHGCAGLMRLGCKICQDKVFFLSFSPVFCFFFYSVFICLSVATAKEKADIYTAKQGGRRGFEVDLDSDLDLWDGLWYLLEKPLVSRMGA